MKRRKRHKKIVTSRNSMFFDTADYERSCASKVGYESEWQAKFAADEGYQRSGAKLSWYFCSYCSKWHLTSRQEKRKGET